MTPTKQVLRLYHAHPKGSSKAMEGKGLEFGCERGQAYAEYADLVWCETSKPCLKEAKQFADAVKGAVPDAMLAYNCSPSFNLRKFYSGRSGVA